MIPVITGILTLRDTSVADNKVTYNKVFGAGTSLVYTPTLTGVKEDTPIDLTESQKNMLVYNYSDNWYNHFINGECPDNFDCEDKIWPNGG